MKTVVLSGYYGFNNAGDEALLAAIIQALRELRPALRLVVLSASPAETRKTHGVEAVNRSCPFCVWRALRQADLLISGGGSLLQDVTSGRSILYYLGVVAMALLLKKPVMFYAQGIGPIHRSWARRLTRWIADRVALITVRDADSRQELERLGVKRPPVMVTADPVLGMAAGWRKGAAEAEARKTENREESMAGGGVGGPAGSAAERGGGGGEETGAAPSAGAVQRIGRVGFALREWKELSGFKEAVRQAADRLAAEGWEVFFIPLHYPDDLSTAKEIARHMSHAATVLEGAKGGPLSAEEVMQAVGSLDLLVGMRLHSLIFAAAAGVPVLGISYDPKVDAFLEQLGEKPVARVEELTVEKLQAAIMFLVERLPQARERLQERTRHLGELARENARLAVELLERTGRGTSEKEKRRVNILGVEVDCLTMPEVLEQIAAFIEAGVLAGEEAFRGKDFPAGSDAAVPRHVVTLNAEMAYRAYQDAKLREVLRSADLVTPDGAGVVWAGRVLGGAVSERVTGIDLVHFLMPLAAAQGWRVFLLGGAPGVAEEAAQRLAERFPGLCIVGTHHGYFARGSAEEEGVLEMIERADPHLLLVGMGSPRQEFWIREQIDAGRLKVPVSIGVGGSLDVIAGRLRRAPAWMQKRRLEWLWRLLQQPSRWRRMLALPAFTVSVWRQGQRQKRRRGQDW